MNIKDIVIGIALAVNLIFTSILVFQISSFKTKVDLVHFELEEVAGYFKAAEKDLIDRINGEILKVNGTILKVGDKINKIDIEVLDIDKRTKKIEKDFKKLLKKKIKLPYMIIELDKEGFIDDFHIRESYN